MCLLLFILFRKKLTFPPSFLWPFPFGVLRKMLSIGLPSGGEQLSYSLSQVVITYFVNMLGNEALAARTYAVNIVTFSYVFAMSVGQGGGICIGHLIGKGHKNAALLLGRYCIRITLMISFSVALLSALLGKSVMGLLSDNPEVVSLTALILCIDVVLELGRAVNILCVNFLRATGDAVYAFIIGLIFMWGVATVGGYVLGVTLGFGLVGMWIAFTMDESIRAALFWCRWQSRRWMGKNIVATNADRVLGAQARVTEAIDNTLPTGAVYVGGKTWTARSESGEPIPVGTIVRIGRMEGVKLYVQPLQAAVHTETETKTK